VTLSIRESKEVRDMLTTDRNIKRIVSNTVYVDNKGNRIKNPEKFLQKNDNGIKPTFRNNLKLAIQKEKKIAANL
jgi:hypothetical protein